MLDLKRVLNAAKTPACDDLVRLSTPWGASIDPGRVLPEHPRPTMERAAYTVLNGLWDYAIAPASGGTINTEGRRALTEQEALAAVTDAPIPSSFDGSILVPFSPEAPLSGVERIVQPNELLWYRRTFPAPERKPDERIVLHLEAVDWACAVRIDGELAATHVGGYLPFGIDITPLVPEERKEDIELSLCVYDPSDAGTQPRGKQRLDAGGIWYTPQSGIWQSVWLEVLPAAYVETLTLQGGADGTLAVAARIADPTAQLRQGGTLHLTLCEAAGSIVLDGTIPVTPGSPDAPGLPAASGTLRLEHPHLWSPDDPYLYRVDVELRANAGTCKPDVLRSYCAFRTVEVRRDAQGVARFCLNGSPLFIRGVLDQGYWPDGLMTAPADEALVHDIRSMRSAGFNMLRKHIKVECARWYYHCDRLGMLVWQDAVSGGEPYSLWHTSRKPTLFSASWGRFRDDTSVHRRALSAGSEEFRATWMRECTGMVRLLSGHPSIVTWVLFNEGWGQFDAATVAELVHALDPSRPIDATSGWYDQRCSDYLSHHNYFRPLEVARDTGRLRGYAARRGCRAFVISEFGGLTRRVEGHAATPSVYGYGDYADASAWRQAVRDVLARADELEAQGLAGFVYTQLSDVESELNGLLTADRRVNKLEG